MAENIHGSRNRIGSIPLDRLENASTSGELTPNGLPTVEYVDARTPLLIKQFDTPVEVKGDATYIAVSEFIFVTDLGKLNKLLLQSYSKDEATTGSTSVRIKDQNNNDVLAPTEINNIDESFIHKLTLTDTGVDGLYYIEIISDVDYIVKKIIVT